VIGTELPDRVEIPEHLHPGASAGFSLRLADGPPNSIEIKPAPKYDARADGHLRVSDALLRQSLDHPPGDQRIILGAAEAPRHEFEARQKTPEVPEGPRAVYFIVGQSGV